MTKDPQTQTSAALPKPRRWVRWALVVSLSLNLLVVGVIAGALFKGGPNRDGPPSERTIAAPYVDAFERSDKRALRRDMRAQLPPRREAMQKNAEDYRAFVETLRADDFDMARASQIMEGQMARVGQTMSLGRKLALERLEGMTPDARRAYADRLERRLTERRKSRPGKAPKDRP